MSTSSLARTLGLILVLGALSFARPALAQQPTQPPGQQQHEMEAMGPMMSQMAQAMLQTAMDFYAKPETARALAAFAKNYLAALTAAGFSRDEALRIVIGHGMPTLPGAR